MALGLYLATLAAAILTGGVYARWIGWALGRQRRLVLSGNLLLLASDDAFVAVLAGFALFLVVLARPRRGAVATGGAAAFGASRPVAGGLARAVIAAPPRRLRGRDPDAGCVRGPARWPAGAVGRVAVAQGAGRPEDPGRAAGPARPA